MDQWDNESEFRKALVVLEEDVLDNLLEDVTGCFEINSVLLSPAVAEATFHDKLGAINHALQVNVFCYSQEAFDSARRSVEDYYRYIEAKDIGNAYRRIIIHLPPHIYTLPPFNAQWFDSYFATVLVCNFSQ